MRESSRPDNEKVIVAQALMELAAATRDQSIDAGVMRVYMPHLDDYTASNKMDPPRCFPPITLASLTIPFGFSSSGRRHRGIRRAFHLRPWLCLTVPNLVRVGHGQG